MDILKKTLASIYLICYNAIRWSENPGESYSGSITVSKTVHGSSNLSSPASSTTKVVLFCIHIKFSIDNFIQCAILYNYFDC